MWTFKDQKETLRTRSRKQIRAWPKDSVYRNNREKDENRNRKKNKDYIYYLENTGMKEKTRIKNENKIGFILLFLFVIFFMGLNMNMKAEAATSASTTITGTEFNAAIKKLAGNNNASYYSEDKKINQIVNAEDIDADKISEVENSSKVSFGDVDIYYYESSDNGNQIVVDGKINLTDGAWTFAYLEALQKVDMSLFNTAEVTNMNRMFNNCPSLQNIDLNSLDTSKATDMNYMFYNCAFLTELDVTKFDTSNVTDMSGMFSNCSSLATLNVGNFNTAKTTNMNRIFDNCAKLNSIDVSGFDTSKVTDMGYMFYNCSLVTKLDVNDFNTENVTDMSGMFSNCLNLASLNVTGFNTANVINMNRMFNNCQNLKELDVTNFDTSNVTDFADIFCNCLLIKSLDISNFNTSNATDLSEMFLSCVKLTSLKVNSFDLANVKKLNNMLYNCPSLSANIIFVSMPAETPSYSDIFRGTANNGKAKITVEFDDNNEELVRAFVKEKNDEDNVILKVDDVIIYPIDYNLNGGTWEENHEGPKTYHEKMSDFTIPTPQKSGYTFRGWVTPDSERPTTEYVVKTGTKGRIELSACWYPDKEISVTYNANGGEFSKGQAENTVKWAWKSVSVTDSENESSNNLDKNGNGGLGYDNNLNELKKLTIDGAETITVNVMYQTEADNDWVAIFEPKYDKNDSSVEILPSDDKANDSLSGKLSGGDSIQTVSYTINGDTAYVLFHTNESDNNYYGYHVTVTGTHSVEKYILTEGTKEEPTNTQKVFDGWYIDKECTKSFTEDHDLNEDCTVYAGWKDETTILIPGADFKNIVNAITENDLSNVKSIQRAEDLPEDDDNVVTISTEDSSHSIYMWFDKANGILHWESDAEDENIFFNENSANMFADLSLLETNDLMNIKTDKIKIADSMFANCNKLTGTITLGSIESYTDMFRGASIEEPYKVSVYYRDNTYDDVVAEVAQKNSEDRVEIVGTEYRIEYILNNGTLTTENSKSVKSDSPDFILNNPTRTGYTFTGWTGSNGTTPELTVTIHPAAMQDRTYTANWTPNNDTTYYVMHWKQKLNGIASAKDSINYELAETESLVGETGATITPDVKSYDGFTAPDVTSDIIMASGSTIVNYYYTRNYYTITFNESNGIESSSGSGRYLYEENVTLSAKVKDNYQITGWSASSGTTITSTGNDSGVALTMPAKNITVTISSSPIEYKITYDLDGGTSLNPTKYNIESDDITLTAPTKEGYEFLGWSGTDLAEPSLEVTIPKGSTGDREYQATWKNLGYHIVYNLDGGTLENKVSYYKITSDDIEVGAPTKTGYTFNGWKNEKTGEITEKILIPTGSTGDREYTALWLINTYQQILNVRYENVDGTFTDYEEIANEVKDYGSTFEWKRDADSEFETGYMSYTVEESRTEDITIYRKKYNLTIDAALDGNYFTNLDSMGTVSVFVNGETVLDDKNGGAISVRSGSTYEVYNIKTNDGYTYNGITKGTQLGIVSANTTVRLSYSIIPYTISYDLNGGSGATGNPKGYTVKSEDIKLEEPTRENYDFIGWSLSSDPAVKETIIKKGSTGDRKYVAKWTAKEFKITYNLDGGTLHGEQNTFTMDSPTFELNTPSKAGYTFLGWTGSNGDTPERLVMIENGSVGDKTYTANWERNANTGYTVNYWRQKLTGDATVKDDKNYTLYESQHFEGETDTEVYAPLKDFDGFETPDDKIVKIKGDGSSVVDYYFVRESFIVTVDTAGNGNIEITMGSDIPKVGNNTFLYGTKVSVTASSKDGVYNWKGWTGTFATSAEKITFSMPAKDVHLTATANEFTPQTYLIKYNLDGGAFQTSVPTSYQDFDNIQIPNPTKEGYEFLGWVGSNGQIPQKDIEITGEMKGDLEYTALWMTSKDIHDIALGLTDIKVRASATDEVTFYPDIEEDGNTTDYVIKWLESDDDGQTWSLIREIAAKHASVDVAKEILGYKMNANCSQSFKQYKYYISNEAGTIQSGKISLYVSEKYHFDEDNKILYIETTGHSDDDLNTYPMNDYSDPRWEQLGEDVIPWKDEKEKAEKIIVNDNISTIGSLAFKDCINLKHVTLPESEALLSINQSAFENTGLLGIILPESVQTVKSNAFKDCNNLRDIYFLNNATIISETEGTIPDSSDVDIKGYDRDTDKYERKHGYPVIYGYSDSSASAYVKRFIGTEYSYNFMPINDGAGNRIIWNYITDSSNDTLSNLYTTTENVTGTLYVPKSIDGYLVTELGNTLNEDQDVVNILGQVILNPKSTENGNEDANQSVENDNITGLIIPDSVKNLGFGILTNTPNIKEIHNWAYEAQTFECRLKDEDGNMEEWTFNKDQFINIGTENDNDEIASGTMYYYGANIDFDGTVPDGFDRIIYDKDLSGVWKNLSWTLNLRTKVLTVEPYNRGQITETDFHWAGPAIETIIIREKTETIPTQYFKDLTNVSLIKNHSIDLEDVAENAFENVGSDASSHIMTTFVNNAIYDSVTACVPDVKINWLSTTAPCGGKGVNAKYPVMFTYSDSHLTLSPYQTETESSMADYSEKDIPWRCVKDYIQYVDIERNVIGISANSFTGLYNLKEVYNRGFDQIIGGEIFDVIERRKTTIGADAIEIEVTEPVNVERIAGRLAAVGFDTITISDLQGLTLVPGKHYIYPNMIKEEVIEELQNDVKYIVPVYVNLDENKEFVDAVPQPEEKGYRLESLCIASGICGDNLRWYVYRDGYMEIKGTGEMYDYAEDGDNVAPWYQYKDKFRTVILPDGITRIGSYAFQGLENVKQMTLTGNIESIGVGAWNNSSITTINFPSNLTSIEGAIFVGANDLTEITGSNAHYHTVDGVLYSRDNKVLVEFMKDQLINPETGRNYSDDHIFKIPDTVEEIAERAFYGIDSLNKIYMTGSVTNIKEKAFAQMPKLYFVDNNANELNVPASGSEAAKVQKVALNAFEGSATKFTSREVLIYRSNTEFATAATAAGYKVRYYDDLTIDHINAHYDGEDIVLGNKVPMSKVVFDIVFTSGLSETTTGDDVRITLNGNGVITKLGENKFNATYNDGYTSTIQTGTFTVNGINKIVAMAAKYNGLDVWYGEKFVPSDVIVTLEYSNGELKTTTGENKAVSFNKEIIQVLDKDSHYGTENVIVKYDDGQNAAFSSEIQIGCSDYLETISATYNGTQTVESTAGISGLTDAIKQNIKISLKWKGNTSVEAIDGADGAVHYSGGSTMVENKLQFVIDYDKLNRYSKTAIVNIPAASNIRDVSIRYTGTPTTVGTEINPANLTIIVYYNDGTQKSFKGDTVDNLTINPNIIKDSGTNIVAVTYNPPGFSKTENVAVQGTIALPVKLIIVERPKKTVYQEGELFDPDGLRVNCLYDNGDIRDVSNEITIENATEITPQTKNVIISYNETRDGNNHIVKTYLSINVNQNQKVLTQDKSFRESYEIERILFRSKKTEDISGAGSANANDNLEDNTDEDDSDDDGKWSEIEITNDSRTQNTELAAAIKAGYGFELKVFTKYKTTRGNDEFKTFLQKSKWDTAYDTKYATVAEYINHKEDWEYLNDIYPQYVPTANPDLMYVKIIKRTADNGDKTTKIGNKDFIVMDKTDRDEKSQIIAEGPWYNSSKIFEFPLRTVNEDGDIVTTDDEVSGDRRVYVSKDAAESGKATTEYIVQVLSPAWYGYESEPKFDDTTNQFIQNDPTSEENPGIVKNWYNGDPYKYLHVAYEFSLYVQKNDDVHTHILQ